MKVQVSSTACDVKKTLMLYCLLSAMEFLNVNFDTRLLCNSWWKGGIFRWLYIYLIIEKELGHYLEKPCQENGSSSVNFAPIDLIHFAYERWLC